MVVCRSLSFGIGMTKNPRIAKFDVQYEDDYKRYYYAFYRSFTQYTIPKDLRSLSNLHSGRLRKLPILI